MRQHWLDNIDWVRVTSVKYVLPRPLYTIYRCWRKTYSSVDFGLKYKFDIFGENIN